MLQLTVPFRNTRTRTTNPAELAVATRMAWATLGTKGFKTLGSLTHCTEKKVLGPATSAAARIPAGISVPFHIGCSADVMQPGREREHDLPEAAL